MLKYIHYLFIGINCANGGYEGLRSPFRSLECVKLQKKPQKTVKFKGPVWKRQEAAVEEGNKGKLPGSEADGLASRWSQESSRGMCNDMMNISAEHDADLLS